MAARIRTKGLSDEWRLKIQTTQIINRLQKFINSEIELNNAQVNAALGLLRKSLPDLAAQASGVDELGKLVIEHAIKHAPNADKDDDGEDTDDNASV